ncbi:hypothetical protein R3P38DRAFT_3304967 [Favolaschia claudopus]|uniref:SWIM-type domain-containing protein n=1 Tax=Favolaschia claudopus TaxID=2862362 RepID=A0AAW0DY78_9AGAR
MSFPFTPIEGGSNVPSESSNPQHEQEELILEETTYDAYVESVLDESTGFFQIARDMFVVNGWDAKAKRSKDTWYHVQQSKIGSEVVIVCTCPTSKPDYTCQHEYLLLEHGSFLFSSEGSPLLDMGEEVILFSRQADLEEDQWLNHFSCPSPNKRGLGGRVVVVYEGSDEGIGHWRCLKDSAACAHIPMCRRQFSQLVGRDLEGHYEEPSETRSNSGYPPFQRVLPLTSAPIHIGLELDSSCPCRTISRYQFRPLDTGTIKTIPSFTSSVEVQTCVCKYRSIGPDCAALGIFNYNNKTLFTQELLDEYTAAFTSSETPFSAWVLVVSRRYSLRNQVFCSAETFRSAWFAYVKLQYLEGDMNCPKCGPSPENTIWDGVTLAFNKKHLLPSLEPPTITQPTSIVRDSTRYLADQQLITDSYSRSLIRKVVLGPPLLMGSGLEDGDSSEEGEDNDTAGSQPTKQTKGGKKNRQLLERLDAIPTTVSRLAGINPPLARLFGVYFGENAVVQRLVPPDVYKRFFVQISSDESILQMVNATALQDLKAFLAAPTKMNATTLVHIPVLHGILAYTFLTTNELEATSDVLSICAWISQRADAILGWLKKDARPIPLLTGNSHEKPWMETGCCYGMPKIRDRPVYPKLKYDTQPDSGGKRGGKCSKFYSQYGERRLTGGIMCVWCTHSVCYGFHCIPKGEGRNDVFSALITRWEKPPKRVIYDFACALGPYCMTREPDFFAETQFLIDDFHAVGHTKCAPAAFLKTYCAVDPRLRYINSSAGECGNSGISRIRKSVSYMSQDRAIVYTKVFLSIWNRQRILSM